MTFTEHSREIAKRFIQTALIVDDRAFVDAQPTSRVGDDRPHDRLKPPVGSRPNRDGEGEGVKPEPAPVGTREDHPSTRPQPQAAGDPAHAFDAQQVIDDFAVGGVFCTVMGIRPGEVLSEVAARVLPLAEQADVFITDWVLFSGGDDEGGGASELIRRVVDEPGGSERFRLILVYTGTAELADIADTIKEELRRGGHSPKKEGDYTVTCGAVRIAVFAKPNAQIDDAVPSLHERLVSSKVLVQKVVEEFSMATAGLMSNGVLVALTAVRETSFRILQSFRPELDAPYLAHRAMLPTPDDACSYLEQLIADEIRSAIEGRGARDEASMKRIEAWLGSYAKKLDLACLVDPRSPIHREAPVAPLAEDLLRLGVGGAGSDPKLEFLGSRTHRRTLAAKPHWKSLTRAFITSDDREQQRARELDHQFAGLTSLRTRYFDSPPVLTAGVLVRFGERREGAVGVDEGWAYGLCIQPECDSVRLSGPIRFPFLLLVRVEQSENPGEQKRFSFVVPGDGEHIYLKGGFSPRDLCLHKFEPTTGSDRVCFQPSGVDRIWTVSSTDGFEFEHVAELKAEQTRRALTRFAHQAGRPGVDEYEWLRRWTS